MTSIAVNPSNRKDVWIGAAAGGMWNSTDGGKKWSPMTDHQSALEDGPLAIGSLAIDPDHANTIYAGTGEANYNGDAYWGIGVLKSTDHGTTWEDYGRDIFGGLSIGKIAIDPTDSQILLLTVNGMRSDSTAPKPMQPVTVGKSLGIWRSDDGGITWKRVLSKTNAGGTDVVFDPADPKIVFAALGTDNSVPADISATGAGIYKSLDGGLTWKRLAKGIPTGSTDTIHRLSLGISSGGTHVYALLAGRMATDTESDDGGAFLLNSSIYVSTDTGVTWTAQPFPDDGKQWDYNIYVAVDPTATTGDTAYVGAINIWKTTDGGSSWKNITNADANGPVHPDQHALTFFSETSSSYYLGNDGGIWSGTAAGKFTNLNAGGLNITQFFGGSIGEKGPHAQLYGGSQDNGEDQYPLGTPMTATQWDEVEGGDGGDTAVDYTNNAIVYEEATDLDISRSTDGGTTWEPATQGINEKDPKNFIAPFVMSPNNHKTLFAGTDRLYITTTGASKWTTTGPAPDPSVEINAIAVAPGNDKYVYVGDNDGKVFRTTDGGKEWMGGPVPDSTEGIVKGLAVDPDNPDIVYASFTKFADGAGQHVFQSIDGGITWKDISESLPNVPFSSILIFNRNGEQNIVVGSDVGVFVTTDDGSTWTRLGSGLPNVPVEQVFMNHSGTKIFVATHGRGMWELAA